MDLYKTIHEAVAKFVTEDNPVWSGTATELVEQLGLDMKPNALTLKLILTAARLLNDYGIAYETTRTHNGRSVTLKRKRDDVLHTAPAIKNIVTIVTVIT